MTAQALHSLFFQINDLCAELPDVTLLPGDHQRLGGHLQLGAPRLVELVAAALRHAPTLYEELPLAGAELAARQAQADAWLSLRDLLAGFSELAADQHLACQSDAAQAATLIIDRLCRGPAPLVPEQVAHRRRQQEGLWPALLHQEESRRGPARRRAGRRGARRRSAGDKGRTDALLQRVYEQERRRRLAAAPPSDG